MLVPEISLTPQMVESFRRLFGSTVAIIHSSLSMGQRADEYRRIEKGGAKIVIGTRSAVFAPLLNIGIIVIDEEGEHTYKSDRSPRYHARTVAKQRAVSHNALLLLASATPSLDSSYNARTGKYTLVRLDQRFNKSELPEVYTIDMKAEYENGNRGNFSMALLHEIELNLKNKEQTLLLLNRRGYYTNLSCIKCGETMKCPNCDLPLTYHKVNDFPKRHRYTAYRGGNTRLFSAGKDTSHGRGHHNDEKRFCQPLCRVWQGGLRYYGGYPDDSQRAGF